MRTILTKGTMLTTRTILTTLVLTPVVLTAALLAPVLCGESPLQVVTLFGQPEVQKTGAAAWSAATLRGEVQPGDAVRTLRGRLTLRTASGQAFRLPPVSRLALLEGSAPDQPTRARLDGGSVWVAVMPGSPPQEQLEVQAGAVTCTVKSGGVGLTLGPDGSVLVRVYHGGVDCAGAGAERRWTRTLGEGNEMLVPSAGLPGEAHAFALKDKREVAWAKSNEDQDLAGGYGAKRPAR
jgi:hypothetical protein